MIDVPIEVWAGCFEGSWRDLIVDAAFAHPAKAARVLLQRIFDDLTAMGVLHRGATVLDCFAGVGTTGIEAASRGVRFIGVELEPRFVDLAKESYALHRRDWEHFGYPQPVVVQGDSRRLRAVLAEQVSAVVSSPPYAERIHNLSEKSTVKTEDQRERYHLGGGQLSTPQHYGTSDGQLAALPAGEVECVISSPPYADLPMNPGEASRPEAKIARLLSEGNTHAAERVRQHCSGAASNLRQQEYGASPGQMGGLPSGELDAVVSSPPYAKAIGNVSNYADREKADADERRVRERFGIKGRASLGGDYGVSTGQLGAMDEGALDAVVSSPPYNDSALNDSQRTIHRDGLRPGFNEGDGRTYSDVVVASPPYAESLSQGNDAEHYDYTRYGGGGQLSQSQRYGSSDGQLGALPAGDVDCVVSSPPYSEALTYQRPGAGGEGNELMRAGYSVQEIAAMRKANDPRVLDTRRNAGYSREPANLGNLQSGAIDAVVSSPPYAEIAAGAGGLNSKPPRNDSDQSGRSAAAPSQDTDQRYGDSTGQLARLPVDAVITSPPYATGQTGGGGDHECLKNRAGIVTMKDAYGHSEGQLGEMPEGEPRQPEARGETFWSAALSVVSECYAVLKPGGVAVWIVKKFVRNRQLVHFDHDWRRLCEHVGFETIKEVHASFVEEWEEHTLFDGPVTKQKQRKSFFRRLAEKKGAPKIDFETVYYMRKPA